MIYDCILRWLIINWMLIFTKQLGKQNQFENNIFFSYCHSVIMTKVSSLNHYCFMFFSCLLLFLFLFYSSQINAEFVFGHHPLHSRCTTSHNMLLKIFVERGRRAKTLRSIVTAMANVWVHSEKKINTVCCCTQRCWYDWELRILTCLLVLLISVLTRMTILEERHGTQYCLYITSTMCTTSTTFTSCAHNVPIM